MIGATAHTLLQEIAHCQCVEACYADRERVLPCRAIVESQDVALAQFQAPEPWSGHIASAPLLFVSSNPSIALAAPEDGVTEVDAYPRWGSSAQETEFYFERRFEHFIVGGTRSRHISASLAKRLACGDPDVAIANAEAREVGGSVRFWQSVRRRAMELFGRDVAPGRDYALTEVVHCKSRSEYGVPEALAVCAERYLSRVVAASGASVIVLLGVRARNVFEDVLHVAVPGSSREETAGDGVPLRHPWGPAELLGRERYVVTLPHPNAWGVPKSVEAYYGSDHLTDLRRVLIGAGSSA